MPRTPDHTRYLTPTRFIDHETPAVAGFAETRAGEGGTAREQAVRLFYAVRDDIRYDLLARTDLAPGEFRASTTLARGYGFCVDKAVLLAAVCRARGVPCRLRFADVLNHLNTPRLRELMETDRYIYHGFVELWLDGRWVKATPAFDAELCARHGVRPIEFDGRRDAIFHEYDARDNRHMEYIHDHGYFADLPHAQIAAAFRAQYPRMYR